MPKTKDLTPSLRLRSANQELMLPPGVTDIGTNVGGLSMFNNSFKRGYGDKVFGSDDNGIWLGAADFANAPFRVNMAGDAVLSSLIAAGVLTKDGAAQELSGEIIIGGVVDGKIILKDSAGNIKIVLDNTGILIDSGKITIKDANSISILDATGLISTANFRNAGVTQSSNQTTTSNSLVDIPSLGLTFTLDRTTNVLVTLDGTGDNTANLAGSDNCIVGLNVDGTDQPKIMSLPGSLSGGGTLFGSSGSMTFLLSLAAGSHTIKGRFRRNSSGTANISFATLTYAILGS
jgi:hypothetical protein